MFFHATMHLHQTHRPLLAHNKNPTVENLEKKDFMEFVAGETLNSHKTFRLTDAGRSEVRNIMCRLARKSVVSMA